MVRISLTELVDFVTKAGSPKLTVVRQILQRHALGYHPTRDYYCKLREAMVELLRACHDVSFLDEFLAKVPEANKRQNYLELLDAFKKFLGGKKLRWVEPPRCTWTNGDLVVSINPELGLEMDGETYFIKLYFKKQKLSKTLVSVVGQIMIEALGDAAGDGKLALLDVRNNRLYVFGERSQDLALLLDVEARAFVTMYEALKVFRHDAAA